MKISIILLALFSMAVFAQQKGTFTDPRDGKAYKTVKIGEQVWMAENLNYNASGSKCYDNKAANCTKYGRLYDWATAMKACPKGWHLPNNAEWDKLMRYVDGDKSTVSPYISKTAGEYLKSTNGWNDYKGKSGNVEDKFGFSALPGGYGKYSDYFVYVGNFGGWYSASENNNYSAYSYGMGYDIKDFLSFFADKSNLYSVRCVRD
jgi:uncharacterized protein (TIGR02145 family)